MGRAIVNKFPLNTLIKELTLMIEKNPGGVKGVSFFTKELAKILKSYFENFHSLVSSDEDPPQYEYNGQFIGQFLLNIDNCNLWQWQLNNNIESWIFICNINTDNALTPTSPFDMTFTVTEDIDQYDIITQEGEIADTTSEAHENIILGMSLYNALTNETTVIRIGGEIINVDWNWDISKPIWINGTSIAQTPPDFINDPTQKWVKIIAKVLEPTKIFIVDGSVIEVNR